MSIIEDEIVDHSGRVNEDEYVVESIVGKKFIETDEGSVLHYHIKWKGWSSAHNTWEPLENLEGCQEMVEYFEGRRKIKREKDEGSDDGSDEEDLSESEHMDTTRKELIECGVETKWPARLIPLDLVGVVTVDKHLCYIVRHQVSKPKNDDQIGEDNCVVVRAKVFRELFPHIVIAFYQNQLLWVQRTETKEQLEEKAMMALELSKNDENDYPVVKSEMDMELDAVTNGQQVEDEEMDEDGLPRPVITVKKDEDLFGLPESHSDSSSDEDDLFQEITVPRLSTTATSSA